jgi:hypothetical protein
VSFVIEKQSPIESDFNGVPAAVWSDGKSFRVAIRNAAGKLALWDGRSIQELLSEPDASLCSAVSFDEKGNAVVLQVSSTKVDLTAGGKTQTLKAFANGEGVATAAESRTSCVLAATGARIHTAWTETDPSAAAEDKGRATIIESWQLEPGNPAAVVKTRHDTAKNSVSNIR